MATSSRKRTLGKLIASYLLEESAQLRTLRPEDAESLLAAADCVRAAYGLDALERSPKLLDLVQLEDSASPSQDDRAKAEALKAQGNAAVGSGELAQAFDLYTAAIRHCPEPAYYSNRAHVLIKLNRLEEAVEDCDRAIMLDPSFARAHVRKGIAFKDLGNVTEARAAFQKAAELDSSHASHLEALEREQNSATPSQQPEAASRQAPQADSNPLAGLLQNAGGLQGLLSNPAVMSMASSVLSNPQMMGAVSSMLGNAQAQASEAGDAHVAQDADGEEDNARAQDEDMQTGEDQDEQDNAPPAGNPADMLSGLLGGNGGGQLAAMAQQLMQSNPALAQQGMALLSQFNQQQADGDAEQHGEQDEEADRDHEA